MEMANLTKTMENLRKNQMEAIYVETIDKLTSVIDSFVQTGEVVSFGGSMTLLETGVMDHLHHLEQEGTITLLDRNRPGNTPEDVQRIFRESFFSDVYFASANAITEDGTIYNVDGNGNRSAAIMFGPKSVVLVVGRNKLVKNRQAAVERVRTVAAPKNAKRLQCKTPCAAVGTCMDCMSEDRICCSYTFLEKQRVKNRIKVIILDGEYGY